MDTPIIEMLKKYHQKNRISFSMPGHKQASGLSDDFSSFSIDVTELTDTDNLYNPKEHILRAKELASNFFQTEETFFLTNGSTGGIHTMLASTCSCGDTVLISQNCHISVINACVLFGLNPVFISQDIVDDFNIPGGIDADLVESLIIKHSPKAVLITSPNYYGICCDTEKIAKTVHKYNIPLLVDEAHGAHFGVEKTLFPKTAIKSGADMVVASAHKTLNSVNQTAFLHFNSKLIPREKVNMFYSMLQTTSPSYVLCASLDYARDDLEKNGEKNWGELIEVVSDLKKGLSSYYKILDVDIIGKYNINNIDKTRIVINLCGYSASGFEISEKLSKEYNIDIEMADAKNIVLIPTPANSENDFKKLKEALLDIAKTLIKDDKKNDVLQIVPISAQISPQIAVNSKKELCPLLKSVNKISSSTVFSYPPAMPVIVPGAMITKDAVDTIIKMKKSGASLSGLLENDNIYVVLE